MSKAGAVFCFPNDFVWGAATAAKQIDGAWNEGGKGEDIWDRWAHTSGKVKRRHTPDVACDHYHLYRSDYELLKTMNLRGYRFSFPWPRLQPLGYGQWNQEGLDHYDRMIDAMLEAGVTHPCATQYHWDLPQNLQDMYGGWASREVCKHFADYTGKLVERFSDRIKMWCTHNEPWCTTYFGYAWGVWAPGVRNEHVGRQVHHNMLVSHGLAVQAARAAARRPIEIGIVLSLCNQEPLDPQSEADRKLADAAMADQDWKWFEPLYRARYTQDFIDGIHDFRPEDMGIISTPTDYLGVNTYFRVVHSATVQKIHPIPGHIYNSNNWEVTPESFRKLLTHIHTNYDAPTMYITENGSCWKDRVVRGRVHDAERLDYLRRHVQQMALAMQDGVKVKGYFAWSLMDNFEWNEGYTQRFGLVHVNYKTQKRTIKDSGIWYGHLAHCNAISLEGAI
jgi:beta-glucosidase